MKADGGAITTNVPMQGLNPKGAHGRGAAGGGGGRTQRHRESPLSQRNTGKGQELKTQPVPGNHPSVLCP